MKTEIKISIEFTKPIEDDIMIECQDHYPEQLEVLIAEAIDKWQKANYKIEAVTIAHTNNY